MENMKVTVDNSDQAACKLKVRGMVSEPVPGDSTLPSEVVKLSRGRPVIVSLAEAEMVDSSGINWLLQCDKQLKAAGGTMHVHSIPPNIEQVLSMLRLQRVLSLCTNEAEALAQTKRGETNGS